MAPDSARPRRRPRPAETRDGVELTNLDVPLADGPETKRELVDYLAANSGAKAAISGFNDPTGDPVKNGELSKNRAQAVQAALVSAGVAADSLELRKPADTTGTAATNAASSRVEVTLFK